jgi:ribonuclease HI
MISTPNCKLTRKWKLGDWSLFQTTLDGLMRTPPGVWSRTLLEEEAKWMPVIIKQALDLSHPLTMLPPRKKAEWWDHRLTELQKRVKSAFSKFRKTRADNDHVLLTQARRDLSKEIRRSKRKAWQLFCNNSDNVNKAAFLNKIVQGRENKSLGLLHNDSSSELLSAEESADLLLQTHFPKCTEYTHKPVNDLTQDVNVNETKFINIQSVREAFRTFGDFKAAGPDGIPPIVFKHVGDKFLTWLTLMFKASYVLGYIPTAWCEAKVIFIPKAGKEDYSDCRSFRPITLSNFVIKGLERVLMWQFDKETLRGNPLSPNQHAFIKGKSTDSALTRVVGLIEDGLNTGQFTLGVFLDIQGAFDNVRPEAIAKGLHDKQAHPLLIGWYEYYLKSRNITFDYRGISRKKALSLGTPQGGVLSPIMWNVAFDSLLNLFDKGSVKACGYADDIGLFITGESPGKLVRLMQEAIDKVLDWGSRTGLTFSQTKSEAILFTRKRVFKDPPPIKMGETALPYKETVKYLGITLDTKLLWTQHLKIKIAAAKGRLLKFHNAIGKLWGTTPKITRWVYTGIIRPALTYGCVVWHEKCTNSTVIKQLSKVNRLALLTMGHFRRSTPTAGLEVISYIQPLDIHIQSVAKATLWRLQDNRARLKSSGHQSLLLKNREEKMELDTIGASDNTNIRFTKKLYSVDLDSFTSGVPDISNNNIIYTDGSRINSRTGGGIVVYERGFCVEERSYSLNHNATVFQAEVYSIMKAAQYIEEMECTGRHYVIYVDSQAALYALASNNITSNMVKRAIESLNSAGEDNIIKLKWVKAHIGYIGNEAADTAAKRGANDPLIEAQDGPRPSKAVIRNFLHDQADKAWEMRWKNLTTCRQTKQWFPTIDNCRSKYLITRNRKMFSVLTQLITGHNFLNRHSKLVQETDELGCRFCMEEEDESSFHVFAECPSFARIRLSIFGHHTLVAPLQWSGSQLVSYLRETDIGRRILDQQEEE